MTTTHTPGPWECEIIAGAAPALYEALVAAVTALNKAGRDYANSEVLDAACKAHGAVMDAS